VTLETREAFVLEGKIKRTPATWWDWKAPPIKTVNLGELSGRSAGVIVPSRARYEHTFALQLQYAIPHFKLGCTDAKSEFSVRVGLAGLPGLSAESCGGRCHQCKNGDARQPC